MARLEAEQKASWKEALCASQAKWIGFGLDAQTRSRAERLGGMAGLIDWHVHGQVSELLAQERIGAEDFCLLPTTDGRRPGFLLYQYGEKPQASAFAQHVRQLGLEEICLAESTFPGDFLAKLKQTLKKEGIRCTKLEPDS